MNSNRSGRRYDREFKNNAVALVRGGRTITEVARDLGVSTTAQEKRKFMHASSPSD